MRNRPASSSKRSSVLKRAAQAVEHAGRCAPDIATAIGYRQVMAVAPAKVVLASLVVRAREEVVEWRFEYRFDFERIERQVEWRCHPTDDRGDAEAGGDFVVGK